MATTYNNLKETTVRGEFRNSNYADNSVKAVAYFDGSMNILSSVIDASGNSIPNINLRKLNLALTTLEEIRGANNIFTGINDFSGNIVSCNIAPTIGNHLCNKTYVDAQVASTAGILSANNIWTGTNDFSGNCPTTNITPSANNMLCRKDYVDTKTTLAEIRGATNTWSQPQTFIVVPTCSASPVLGSHLVNKTYADTKTTLAAVVAANNVWTGTNAFNTSAPSTSIAPSGGNDLCNKTYVDAQVATKTTLAAVVAANNVWTGTNAFNTSAPSTSIAPSGGNDLCNKTYVDAQVATKASIAQVEASALTLSGAVNFTNAVPPACAVAPTGGVSLTNKTYVDGQIATRPTTADILTGTNVFTNTNTFQSVIFNNIIRGVNPGDSLALYATTTTGTLTFLNNASFSGNFNLCATQSGLMNLGLSHTGTINIATGAAATATVNIGRSTGTNVVNIGAWTFTGNNLEFPATFTTPSVGYLGYSISSLGILNQVLTTDTWLNIETISLGAGVWILTGSMNMSKQAAGATGTTISEILFGLSETVDTVDAINYYSAQYDSMAVAHQRVFAANNTRKFILTATTTIYLNIKCIFTIGTGTAMRVNDCQIEAVRVG
jgi:hypothetical protein